MTGNGAFVVMCCCVFFLNNIGAGDGIPVKLSAEQPASTKQGRVKREIPRACLTYNDCRGFSRSDLQQTCILPNCGPDRKCTCVL